MNIHWIQWRFSESFTWNCAWHTVPGNCWSSDKLILLFVLNKFRLLVETLPICGTCKDFCEFFFGNQIFKIFFPLSSDIFLFKTIWHTLTNRGIDYRRSVIERIDWNRNRKQLKLFLKFETSTDNSLSWRWKKMSTGGDDCWSLKMIIGDDYCGWLAAFDVGLLFESLILNLTKESYRTSPKMLRSRH